MRGWKQSCILIW